MGEFSCLPDKMMTTTLFLLTFEVAVLPLAGAALEPVRNLAHMVNTMSDANSGAVVQYVSDFLHDEQKALLDFLSVPATAFNMSSYSSWSQVQRRREKCPVFLSYSRVAEDQAFSERIHDSDFYMRDSPMTSPKRGSLLFFWLTSFVDLDEALNVLENSIMKCKQKLHPGLLHPKTRIFFVSDSSETTRRILSHPRIQRHARTAVLQVTFPQARGLLFRQWGFVQALNLHQPPQTESMRALARKIFELNYDMSGETLRVGCMPWAHFVLATLKAGQEGPNRYKDYYGYEINLVNMVAKTLGFDLYIFSPEDGQWGILDPDNGTWNGMVGLLYEDRADVIFSGFTLSTARSQVIDLTEGYQKDFFGWVAPAPQALPTYLSLIKPLQPLVWLLMIITLLILGFVVKTLSVSEARATDQLPSRDWSTYKASYWYCFGTLMGEAITRDTKSEKLPALRQVIAAWVLFCMLMGYSYTGNLKAYLTTPSYTSPIDSLKAAAESSYTPGIMHGSGEEEETLLYKSDNPHIKALLSRQEKIPFLPTPDISRVYNREIVFFDWRSGLLVEIFKKYTKPGSGEQLVFLSNEPVFVKKDVGMGLNRLNPWNEQINDVLRKLREGGLTDYIELLLLRQLKKEMLESGDKPVEVSERPIASPLNLDDFKGTLVFFGSFIGVSCFVAVLEMMEQLQHCCTRAS